MAAKTTVEHGRWHWNLTGNKKLLRCNAHVDCPVLMRDVKQADGTFYLQTLDLAHSLEENPYDHASSKLTIAQAKSVSERVEAGKKPREMFAHDVLNAVKADPSRKRAGGAEGMLLACRPLRPTFLGIHIATISAIISAQYCPNIATVLQCYRLDISCILAHVCISPLSHISTYLSAHQCHIAAYRQ